MDCNIDVNKAACTCTYDPCTRKGKCCECISYHRALDELPGCLSPPELERTYDRSIARFIRAFTKKSKRESTS